MKLSRRTLLLIGLQAAFTYSAFAEDEPRQPRPRDARVSNYNVESVQKTRRFKLVEDRFVSSSDGSSQPFRYYTPGRKTKNVRPLLVFLHSWSADYRQYKEDWIDAADQRNWIFIQPDFRGPNSSSDAGGSVIAQQDVLDCIDWAISHLNIDSHRIYLAGASGGGHMAMLLAGRHPERFSAVSAWVGISDLEAWYRFQTRSGTESRYAAGVAAVCGGAPGSSPEIDVQYYDRSPIHWVAQLGDLPIDLAAGVHDGKKGNSVPITQTLNAYNAIAQIRGAHLVSDEEIAQLFRYGMLISPSVEDLVVDTTFERDIRMRRHAGNARLTIFDGGHEAIPQAACAWLEGHRRKTVSTEQ